MEQIRSSKKYQNGIQVLWSDTGKESNDFFSFEELVDQKINALDLLNNPRLYRINMSRPQAGIGRSGMQFCNGQCLRG